MKNGKLDELEHRLIMLLIRGSNITKAAKILNCDLVAIRTRLRRVQQLMGCNSVIELCCTYAIGLMEDESLRIFE